MKTAICYYSRHHGNTLKVLEAMAEAAEIDLIDVTSRMAARLPQYDRIGFASGIYYSKFHDTVVHYAAQYGYDTFGPFKLIGGMAKGHPDADDLQRARAFIQAL